MKPRYSALCREASSRSLSPSVSSSLPKRKTPAWTVAVRTLAAALCLAVAVLCAAPVPAYAASYTWLGWTGDDYGMDWYGATYVTYTSGTISGWAPTNVYNWPGQGWSIESINWAGPGLVPDGNGLTVGAGDTAIINSGTVQVYPIAHQGGRTTTVGSLSIGNAELDVYSNVLMSVGDIANNGLITSSGTLNVVGTVSGMGTICNYGGWLNGSLNQSAGHTISGYGTINATLANSGVVNANGSTIYLNGVTTNNGIMEQSGGGILDINGITVTQGVGGQIQANGGAYVQFDGATTISGGVLSASNDGYFVFKSGTTTFSSLTNNAEVDIPKYSLNVTGDLTNNGRLVPYTGGNVTFNGGTVSGSGGIVLSHGDGYLSGTLTQAAGHTISGYGYVNAALTNNGTVNANVSGNWLYLNGPVTNNGIIEQSGNGFLDINGITVTQGTGGQLQVNSGGSYDYVQFDGATTISGGLLNACNGGAFKVGSGTTTFVSVTNNAEVDISGGQTLNVAGDLINNGLIYVYNGWTWLNIGGGTVSGTGSIYNAGGVITGTLTQAAGHTISGRGQINAALTNNGLVNANVSGQTLSVNGATTNNGTMQASNGVLSIATGVLTNLSGSVLTGGTFEVDANSTISLPGSVVTNAASVILNGANSNFGAINSLATNAGSFSVLGGRSFTTAGDLTNSGALGSGSGSTLTVSGTLTETSTGLLWGAGTVNATTMLLSGTVSPGDNGPGVLHAVGDLRFSNGAILAFELANLAGLDDRIDVTGNLTLAGVFNVTALPGFDAGDYDLFNYTGSITNGGVSVGTFPAGYSGTVDTASVPGEVVLHVTKTPEPSSLLLLLGGLGMAFGFRRGHRQSR